MPPRSNVLNLPIQEQAKYHVFMYIKARLEITDTHVRFTNDDVYVVCEAHSHTHVRFTNDDVYVVWFSKTLQNWKALVSSVLPDGMYYEVTYNGDKEEVYLDAYKKLDNIKISCGRDEA